MHAETLRPPRALPLKLLNDAGWVLLLLFPALLVTTRAGMDVALTLIALLFIIRSMLANDFRWAGRPDVLLPLVFWAYISLDARLLSLPSHEIGNACAWLRFVVFYAAIRYWLLISHARLRMLLDWMFIVLAFSVVDTLVQYITGTSLTGNLSLGYRLTGGLSHPNIGNYLLKMTLPTFGGLLGYALFTRSKARLIAAILLGAAVTALIPLTGERSITLLLMMAIVLIGVACFATLKAQRKWVLIGMASLAIVAGALALTQPVVAMRFAMLEEHLGQFWDTPYGQLYQAAWLLWNEHPFFGVGPGYFFESCKQLMTHAPIVYCDMHAHNTYLQLMSETGAVGIFLFVAFVLLLARGCLKLIRRPQPLSLRLPVIFASAGIAVCLFPVIVTQSMFSNWPAALMWFSMGLSMTVITLFAREAEEA